MTPQVKPKWHQTLPAALALISFLLGIGINSLTNIITNASKVDNLTQQVADMSKQLQKLNDKMDTRDDKLSAFDTRITVLEAKK